MAWAYRTPRLGSRGKRFTVCSGLPHLQHCYPHDNVASLAIADGPSLYW